MYPLAACPDCLILLPKSRYPRLWGTDPPPYPIGMIKSSDKMYPYLNDIGTVPCLPQNQLSTAAKHIEKC